MVLSHLFAHMLQGLYKLNGIGPWHLEIVCLIWAKVVHTSTSKWTWNEKCNFIKHIQETEIKKYFHKWHSTRWHTLNTVRLSIWLFNASHSHHTISFIACLLCGLLLALEMVFDVLGAWYILHNPVHGPYNEIWAKYWMVHYRLTAKFTI